MLIGPGGPPRSPFNSRLKWMKTIHAPPLKQPDQRRMAILKVGITNERGSCAALVCCVKPSV
jgi:hypothetical protein